jgi:TetR/AcrR family transcriptional regulator, transcriptional repressor for nem operon
MATAYRGALEEAAKRGELSTECTPAIEAETLFALIEGLRVMTKADTDPTALTDVVNSVLDRILPSASLAD